VKSAIDKAVVLRLAADAQLDPRTVERAIREGLKALKSGFARERLRIAAEKIGLKFEDAEKKAAGR
jgi:hypothetical protein